MFVQSENRTVPYVWVCLKIYIHYSEIIVYTHTGKNESKYHQKDVTVNKIVSVYYVQYLPTHFLFMS